MSAGRMDIGLFEVKEEDLWEISELISSVFNRPHQVDSIDKLRVMLFANPDGQEQIPKGWILRRQNRIVGFLGNVVRRVSVFGKDQLVTYTSNYVVDPSCRFHGLRLAKAFIGQDQVDHLLCSSGSDNSITILKRLGARQIAGGDEAAIFVFNSVSVVSALQRKRGLSGRCLSAVLGKGFGTVNLLKRCFSKGIARDKLMKVQKAINFNSDVDEFYRENQLHDKITSHRDSKRLNWLFVDGSIKRPRTSIVNAYKRDKLCGYAVTQDQSVTGSKLKYRKVKDIFFEKGNYSAFDVLTRYLIRESMHDGMDCLEFQSIPQDLIQRLVSYGAWRRKLGENPFLIYSKNKACHSIAANASKWYIVPSDGDCGGW